MLSPLPAWQLGHTEISRILKLRQVPSGEAEDSFGHKEDREVQAVWRKGQAGGRLGRGVQAPGLFQRGAQEWRDELLGLPL